MSISTTAVPRWIAVLFIALVGLSSPALVHAQEDEMDEEEQATKYFENGRKLHTAGKYPEAISELLKAYNLRPAPPILLYIGKTYEKIGDKKKALRFYKEYLLKARMTDAQRPLVEKVVKSLSKEVGGTTGAVTSSSGTDTPDAATTTDVEPGVKTPRIAQLIHTPVDSAKRNTAITLMAELPPNVDADSLVVRYRKRGERRFRSAFMEPQGEAFVTQIPPHHVSSTSMQYFIEALVSKGNAMKIVARAGAKGMPHIIVIEGGIRPGIRGPRRVEDPNLITGPQVDVKSPYRTWIWVGAGATAAFLAVGLAGSFLAMDRANAMGKRATEQSCPASRKIPGGGTAPSCADMEVPPSRSFDGDVRDWESEGKTFSAMGQVFIALSITAAAATGVMFFMDRKYVAEERRRKTASSGQDSGIRVMGAPWAGPHGGGIMGRIDF